MEVRNRDYGVYPYPAALLYPFPAPNKNRLAIIITRKSWLGEISITVHVMAYFCYPFPFPFTLTLEVGSPKRAFHIVGARFLGFQC